MRARRETILSTLREHHMKQVHEGIACSCGQWELGSYESWIEHQADMVDQALPKVGLRGSAIVTAQRLRDLTGRSENVDGD